MALWRRAMELPTYVIVPEIKSCKDYDDVVECNVKQNANYISTRTTCDDGENVSEHSDIGKVDLHTGHGMTKR